MKCPNCNGTGKIKIYDGIGTPHNAICGWCDGAGEYLQTNEEWFCSLSTEEKANVFANATYSTAVAPMKILVLGKEFEQKKWEMWLKQPHGEVNHDKERTAREV